jgi:hypothetical protein
MRARDQLPGETRDPGTRSGGKALAPTVRRTMESRLGHSFADVRVHSDGAAAGQARALGARAFAIGRDVVFGAHQFAPGTPAGQALLAHELAHVVQQRAPGDADPVRAEHEASQAGRAVASGGTFAPAARTGPQIAMQEEGEGEAAERAEVAQATTMLKEERLSFTHDRIAATTAWIGREMTALVKLPEAQRPAARMRIHGLERELASALTENVGLLAQRIADLEARAVAGENVKPELADARRELNDNRADLETLKGVFSPAKGEAFEDTYRNKVKGLHCMGAAYAGLGALTSPEQSTKVEQEVGRKAEASAKRNGPDLDQFITVMNTANVQKLAGPKQTAKWSRKRKVWTPSLEDVVRARVNKRVPGFYFFGLALAEAFHSVLIGVSTWDAPRTMWCDQNGCTVVNGALDNFARGKLADYVDVGLLKYEDWDSYIWQVVPPAAASVMADPGGTP